MIDAEGWLHSGRQGVPGRQRPLRDRRAHLRTSIVLNNGEKVSPTDMESAIQLDPCSSR